MSSRKGSSQRRYEPAEKENAVRLVRLRREETGESRTASSRYLAR